MPKTKLKHLGIIMDGNRRWAKKQGLPTLVGHQRGYQTAVKVDEWCFDRGIKILTPWAFSTENWNRSKKEVSYLMNLTKKVIKEQIEGLNQRNIKIQFLGRLNELPKNLLKSINEAMELTKNNARATLNFAFNYGGQAEIIDATNRLINDKIKKVTPEILQKYLYDPEMPAPDLIIRTSGDERTSGFLLWQSAYSELYFCKKYWPDFSEKDLDKALEDYNNRQRRFGGN
jgi:undecaprenyl diphosphate synthase